MTFKISDDDYEYVFLQVLSIYSKYVFDVVILVLIIFGLPEFVVVYRK